MRSPSGMRPSCEKPVVDLWRTKVFVSPVTVQGQCEHCRGLWISINGTRWVHRLSPSAGLCSGHSLSVDDRLKLFCKASDVEIFGVSERRLWPSDTACWTMSPIDSMMCRAATGVHSEPGARLSLEMIPYKNSESGDFVSLEVIQM